MSWTPFFAGLAGALLVAAPAAAQPAERTSTVEDRSEVAVTVYNQDFGLVREVRELELGRGRVALEFADVAATIQPETVHIRPLRDAGALRVLEQNYLYDLLSPQKLLEKYVGRRVRVFRWNEKTGRDEEHEAEVLAVNGGTILRIGDEITFDFPGRISFPEIPENLIAKPTLRWLLDSRSQRAERVEVSYLARSLNWKADYVMVVNADDTEASVTGWVTLTNQSGAAYPDARLKLVAGDVQRVTDARPRELRMRAMAGAVEEAQFREESFFEYHLYTLERPTTLLHNEQKQVTLLEAPEAGVTKRLVFRGQPHWFRSPFGRPGQTQKVSVLLELENSEKAGLGMPLPRGIVRVYKADASGAQQFIGEDRIDHTPRDETVRIKTGEAFDVVAERTQADYDVIAQCVSESAWRVEVRNHKDRDEDVEVIEPASGDWEILRSSHDFEKLDAHTFRFVETIPKRGAVTIEYRVRVKWC